MFDWMGDVNGWVGLLTLALLEIVLGIDNIIFISILAGKLPEADRSRARKLGLMLALVSRIILLLGIGLVVKATHPLFTLPFPALHAESREVSLRDLVLFLGGAFLIWKSVKEIHAKLEGKEEHGSGGKAPNLSAVLVQIMVMDVIFSLDSVITAVGMVDQVTLMILAVMIAVGIMLVFSTAIAEFVDRHPTVKMLALAFLILIGFNLMAEGSGQEIPKGYTYAAMGFAIMVEFLNMRARKKAI
ncbi:TerC protein [Fimbriimonas ginsengisoli Gsoil 348]|uniref:TerC protein n=2 Tax=Fimbriimonas ginsengisoli TaxID=1005039 RepID=A0A068NNP7_FIMGI|nr:TerC protein [Fimbriimonas ginsengisoli Gsoil 348]